MNPLKKGQKMKEIWKTLISIDCSKHIEKKGNLSYLSWAWAWNVLCDNFPDSNFEFEKDEVGSEFWSLLDGSGEVRCRLTVNGHTRSCWLPVMDYKNQAISNPNSRDLNDAKMRCLVKCIALFGLGLYIYAGEDIPEKRRPAPAPTPAPEEIPLNTGCNEDNVPSQLGLDLLTPVKIPVGKWQGRLLLECSQADKEKLWENREHFADYPDFMSALQEWRKRDG